VLPDVVLLDAKIAEVEAVIKKADSNSERRKAKERKEDLMRLKRVEQIYVWVSPPLQPQKVDRATGCRSAFPSRMGYGPAQAAAGHRLCDDESAAAA
jgi:hypothetical protein